MYLTVKIYIHDNISKINCNKKQNKLKYLTH